MASSLWGVMQLIESNRHWAEQLEAAASTADPTLAPVLTDMAVERRKFAEQVYQVFLGDELTAA